MDSITQFALGAAVGEAVLGRHIGNRALLWGGISGTLPDLDVLAAPFLTDFQELAVHRGLSHSLFLAVVFAPVMGRLMALVYPRAPASWKQWSLLVFLTLVTHILLDCFTTYGTQVFQPFSDYPVSFNAVSIIDPLYTLPLIAGAAVALFRAPSAPLRRRANLLGLLLSSAYLIFVLVVKLYVSLVFAQELKRQEIGYDRMLTTPMLGNSLLWMGLADDGDSMAVGLYSTLDGDRRIAFHRLPKRTDLLAPYAGQPAVERLLWFSRSYFTVTPTRNALLFHDLRFGRTDFWLTGSGRYVFTFLLRASPADPSEMIGFTQLAPSFDRNGTVWRAYLGRILGHAPSPTSRSGWQPQPLPPPDSGTPPQTAAGPTLPARTADD